MNTEIESFLRKFITENLLFVDGEAPLSDNESLLGRGVIDSTGIMELVECVSSHFKFEVPVRDINQENFDSISRLANYVRRRQESAAQPGSPVCAAQESS